MALFGLYRLVVIGLFASFWGLSSGVFVFVEVVLGLFLGLFGRFLECWRLAKEVTWLELFSCIW